MSSLFSEGCKDRAGDYLQRVFLKILQSCLFNMSLMRIG